MHATNISMYRSNLKDRILGATNLDQHYLQVKESLQQGKLQKKFKDYKMKEDEFLMYKGKVYVPKSKELKNIVMGDTPNVPMLGT